MNDKFKALLQGLATEGWEYGDGTLVADDAKAYLDYVDQLERELEEAISSCRLWQVELGIEQSCQAVSLERIEQLEQELRQANDTVVSHANTISRIETANVHLQAENERLMDKVSESNGAIEHLDMLYGHETAQRKRLEKENEGLRKITDVPAAWTDDFNP